MLSAGGRSFGTPFPLYILKVVISLKMNFNILRQPQQYITLILKKTKQTYLSMRDPDKNVEFITVQSRYRLLIIITKEWQLTLDDFCYFSSLKTKGNNLQGSPQLLRRVTHIKDLFRKCTDWIYFSIIQNFEVFTCLLISTISRALLKGFNRVDSKSDLTPVKNNIN